MTGRPRILLAPVTVSPTKPLTPSHLKVLLSMDIVDRATATFADVTHVYQPLAHAASRQVAGFWEYLDRNHPDLRPEICTEERIGELYGDYQRADRVPYEVLDPVVRRAAAGWAHPVSTRLLDLWDEHYRTLGMVYPVPHLGYRMPAAELIDLLAANNLCIDGRPLGAPVYLDATAVGLPLRVMVGADGQANYLMSTLSELVPLLAGHDHVVLAHDTEIRADYRTIAHVLSVLGTPVSRLEFTRVPIGGVAQSTRFGGWQGYTVGALAEPLVGEFGAPAFALGYRLYLLAGLDRAGRESFSTKHLRRWVHRARQLVEDHAQVNAVDLSALAGRELFVDPYRVVTTLLGRDPVVPPAALLDVLLGRVASGAARM